MLPAEDCQNGFKTVWEFLVQLQHDLREIHKGELKILNFSVILPWWSCCLDLPCCVAKKKKHTMRKLIYAMVFSLGLFFRRPWKKNGFIYFWSPLDLWIPNRTAPAGELGRGNDMFGSLYTNVIKLLHCSCFERLHLFGPLVFDMFFCSQWMVCLSVLGTCIAPPTRRQKTINRSSLRFFDDEPQATSQNRTNTSLCSVIGPGSGYVWRL